MRNAILTLLLFAGTFTASAQTLTLDELLAKNLAARGGAEKIAALKSVRFSGKMKFSGWGGEMEISSLVARPWRLRSESSMQGLTSVNAWDGHEGWSINPFGGRKDPERTSADDAKGMIDEADLDGYLIGWKESGHKLEYLGTEDVDGTEAHKLKVTLASGDVKYIYLDPDYFLEIRITSKQTVRGVEYESESDFGDYAQVEGVWFPMAIESGSPGGSKGAKTMYSKAEANVPAGDQLFSFPETKPAAPAAPAASKTAKEGGKS